MSDLLAGLFWANVSGGLLLLVGLFVAVLLVGFGYGIGRRSAFREVDAGRAEVRRACEQAAAERVAVPGQRREAD